MGTSLPVHYVIYAVLGAPTLTKSALDEEVPVRFSVEKIVFESSVPGSTGNSLYIFCECLEQYFSLTEKKNIVTKLDRYGANMVDSSLNPVLRRDPCPVWEVFRMLMTKNGICFPSILNVCVPFYI